MHSINEDMQELQKQLKKGSMQKAYRALLSYMTELRTHFVNKYGDPAVSGFYQGYMDMTYFALFPPALKRLDLKVAIVFNYEAFRFEAWLAGRNRKVQRQYWELFRDSVWTNYRIVAPATGIDAILECDLAEDFDLSSSDALTSQIETATVAFIDDIESFLSKNQLHEEATLHG
jgi:hypothetical protein